MSEDTRTSVVNILRYGDPPGILLRTPQARWPKECVYIGRSGKGLYGIFGNPVVVSKKTSDNVRCPECGERHADNGSTLPCYETYLRRRIEEDASFRHAVRDLYGKTLVCWCCPKPCHGDVLARIAADLAASQDDTTVTS